MTANFCGKCGAHNENHASFCRYCGKPLTYEMPQPKVMDSGKRTLYICPYCDNSMIEQRDTCSKCGKKGPFYKKCLPGGKVTLPASKPVASRSGISRICEACGSRNSANALSCIYCGNVLSTMHSVEYSERFFRNQSIFRKNWRAVFGSFLFLMTAILFTLLFIARAGVILTDTSQLTEVMALLGLENIPDILILLSLVPSVLTAIGLWLIYAEGIRDVEQPIMNTGISIVYGVQVFELIASCVLLLAVLLVSCFAFEKVADYSGSESKGVAEQFTGIWIVMIIAAGVVLSYYICMLRVLHNAKNGIVDTSGAGVLSVFFIIMGVFSIIALLFTGESVLQLSLSALQYFMFSTVIRQYRTAMESVKDFMSKSK